MSKTRNHNGKRWDRLCQGIKILNRRLRRAKEQQAVRTGAEVPLFKQTDRWDAL